MANRESSRSCGFWPDFNRLLAQAINAIAHHGETRMDARFRVNLGPIHHHQGPAEMAALNPSRIWQAISTQHRPKKRNYASIVGYRRSPGG